VYKRQVVGTGNTLTNATNATVIGNSNNLTNDTIVDSNTNLVLGDYGAGRYANTVISDRTLRLGRADIISGTSSNTTGILNFNDSVEANSAFSNVGGFVGYFPPPTTTNNYYFFNAFSENVNASVFQPGASPTASRINISMDPNLDCVGYKFDSNTSNGGGVYYTVSQNNASASSRGIVTFDCRHQNQNYEAPDGHSLFEVTSGYGRTKFLIKQVNGSSNVGIGTTSPTQLLHVSGNARVTGAYYDSNNSSGTANQVLVSTVTGTDWVDGSAIPGVPGGSGTLNTIPLWTPDGDTLGNSIITQPTSAEVRVAGTLKVNSTVAGYSSTKIQTGGFSDSQSGINILNSTTGYGYILFGDGSGADLYRGQVSYKHGDDFMAFNTAGAEKMRILANGNVGIGTTAPTTKLYVYNGEATIASATDGVKLSYSNGNSSGIIDTAFSDNNLEFRTNGTAKMWIANGGNVGIGTTSPTFKLHVNSTDASDNVAYIHHNNCLLYTSPSPRDRTRSRMPSSA